jgi:GMP synthase (glutamine-hydrolysing)
LTSNVLVVDFGAQYAQLIARRVREAHVYSEIVPSTISAEDVRAKSPSAIILSGGPKSVYEVPAPSLDPAIYDLGIPVLGICYGAQLMAQQLGGEVAHTGAGEYGRTELTRQGPSVLMSKWPVAGTCWMSHGDAIATPPDGFVVSASSPGAKVAVMEDVTRHLYAVQFHPEVVHTEHGQEHCGHRTRLDELVDHPRSDRGDSSQSWFRAGALRAIGRRRFGGRGGTRDEGRRHPTDLRLCGHRTHAQERG